MNTSLSTNEPDILQKSTNCAQTNSEPIVPHIQTQTHRHRHTDTDRHTDTHRHTNKHTNTETKTQRQTHKQTYRHTDRDTYTGRAQTQTCRQKDRQAGRQAISQPACSRLLLWGPLQSSLFHPQTCQSDSRCTQFRLFRRTSTLA